MRLKFVLPRGVRMVCGVAALAAVSTFALHAATVTEEPWGQTPDGKAVERYTLKDGDAEVQVITYGARITAVRVPDRDGKVNSVVLGFDQLAGYLDARTSVMGATIGRFANRIAKGEFALDGTTYHIPLNNGGNALHGGTIGFDKKLWTAEKVADGVVMTLVSPDGDMGFPGNLTVRVTFELIRVKRDPALRITYNAATDKATVVNFTNHTYFNLADDTTTPVFDDIARIDADSITPVSGAGIPTGTIDPLKDTAFDFRSAHAIGAAIPDRGYDQNFVLRPHPPTQPVAEVDDPASGRTIQVLTDQPGLQFYVPRFGGPPPGANANAAAIPANPNAAAPAPARRGMAAFCLETQHYPDAPNQPAFPTTTVLPGKPFHSFTTYIFGVEHGPAAAKSIPAKRSQPGL